MAVLMVLILTISSMAVLASNGDAPTEDEGDRASASPSEWITYKGDNQRTGVSASEAPSVDKVLWGLEYTGSVIYSSPTVWNGTVYIGVSGSIKAIWAKNGTQRWSYSAPNPVHSSPVISDGVIYAGVNDYMGTAAVAVDATTGEEVWNSSIPDFCTASPLVLGTNVYIGSQNGLLYSLRTSDGVEQWNFSAGGSINYGSIAEANGFIYFGIEADGDQNGKVFALDATTGDEKWNMTVTGSVWGSPSIAGGKVLISTAADKSLVIEPRNGYVYAFNLTTGAQAWKTTNLGMVMASPSINNGRVYVGTFGKVTPQGIQIISPQMYCLALSDGDIIWNRTVSHLAENAKVWSSVTIAGAKIIFGDELGYLNVWNINGIKIWDHPIRPGAAIKTTPAVAGEMIFAANTLGDVTGFGSQPDLSVNATGIEVDDEYPHLGQRVNVRAKIVNLGDKTASGRVFMYNGTLDDWDTVINSTTVTLQPGRSTFVYGVWSADDVGTRAVWVRIMDVVPNEEDVSNNEAKRVIEVLKPAEGWLTGRADPTGIGFLMTEPPDNNITKWLWAAGATPGEGMVTTLDLVLFPVGQELVALDRLQGIVEWTQDLGSDPTTPPAVGDGAVFMGTEAGQLIAFDLEEGTQRFARSLDGPVTAGPNVVNRTVVVATSPGVDIGTLWALDTFDGSDLWRRDMGATVMAPPAMWMGAVYTVSDDGALQSLNETDGSLYWQYPVGNAAGSSLTSAPLVSEGSLYVASTSGFVYCLDADPNDGVDEGKVDPPGSEYDVIWTYKQVDLLPFEESPSLVSDRLVLRTGDDGVLALNVTDGSIAWTTTVPDGQPLTLDIIGVNGSVVVGGKGIYILAVDSGAITWSYTTTPSPMVGGPTAVDGMLFVTDTRGIIFAFGKVENQPPVARISAPAPDSQFRINQSITFDGSNSSDDKELPDTSFRWDFDDGNSSLSRITTHRYATEGQYTITLTVTDIDGESDNTSIIINILGNHDPILDWPGVEPDQGDAVSTMFNFSVRYTDPDNDPPETIQLRFANEPEYPPINMVEVDPNDMDYTDGKIYFYISTLGSRPYPDVTFTTSDGIATAELVVKGPTVLQEKTFPNSIGDIEVRAVYVGPHSMAYIPVTSPPSTYPPGLYPIGIFVELYLNTSFLKEANISINYTFHDIVEMDLSTLAVYRWSVTDQDAGWEYLEDSHVDNITGIVSAPIPSLQNDIYTVLGNKENPPPNNPPVAIIVVDGETYSPGATVKMTYTPGEVIDFDASKSYDPDEESLNDFISFFGWNFQDGTNSEGKLASHSYDRQGQYRVTLTVRDSYGTPDTVEVVITVREEGGNTLLYFLVIIGIIVILLLLFFPKGNNSGSNPNRKVEVKEKAKPDDFMAKDDDLVVEDDEVERTELDDIIDELEVPRTK
jgi:outer membrane protein assembly factor BamB